MLVEPIAVAVKGIGQAYEIQRRLRVWQPRRKWVPVPSGMTLRLGGLDVTVFSRHGPIVAMTSSNSAPATSAPRKRRCSTPPPGTAPSTLTRCRSLPKTACLCSASITGGYRKAEMPADKINLDFVLGNKVVVGTVDASRGDFEEAYATWRWPK